MERHLQQLLFVANTLQLLPVFRFGGKRRRVGKCLQQRDGTRRPDLHTHGQRYRNVRCAVCTSSSGNADSDAYRDCHSYSDRDRNRHGHSDCDRDRNRHGHSDCDRDRNRNANCDCNADCDAHLNRNAHCDGYSYSDRNRHNNGDANRDAHCDADRRGVSCTDAVPSRANMVVGITLGRAVTDGTP